MSVHHIYSCPAFPAAGVYESGRQEEGPSKTGWRSVWCAEEAPREVPSECGGTLEGPDGVDRDPALWTGYGVLSKGQGMTNYRNEQDQCWD